jgi:hypothetical protein
VGSALTDAVVLFAAFLVLVVAAAAALASRRYLLERGGGTVECGLRRPAETGAWRLGVASYQQDELHWNGAIGVLLRPEYVFPRRSLMVVSRRPSSPLEATALGPDRIVIEIRSGSSEHVDLAMTEQALTGFLAWIEASPPGSHLEEIALNLRSSPERSMVPRLDPAFGGLVAG